MQIELISHQPRQQVSPQPVLLLHGAWHGAWCWAEQAMPDLAARGLVVHACSVRGHGNTPTPPQHWRSTILDYAREVRAVIAALGGRPLLIGHSSGGYISQLLITGAVGPIPPLSGAVLLCSSPVNIGRYFMNRGLRGRPMVNLRALLRRDPATVRRAFLRPDTSEAELDALRNRLVAEPPLVTLSSMLLRPRPARNTTPTLVIAAERDAIFDLEAQRATAQTYRAELVIVPEATHDVMLDPAWPVAGAAIARFAATL